MNLPMLGDNTQTIDYAKDETARLRNEYNHLNVSVMALLAEADAIPDTISDDETKSKVTTLIKRLRDEAKRIDGIHELEKIPYLRRGQAVDQYFFGLEDKLAKREKRGKDGAKDRLEGILTDYDVRKLAEEQERRRLAAAEAARIAAAAAQKAAREAQEAEEARLAAERARKPEAIATKQEVAQQAEAGASEAKVEAAVAESRAEDARIQTLATPADIMRTRGDDGTLSTMGTDKFAEITDRATLNLEKLRAYIPIAALETALRKYADSVGYSNDASVQIAGAKFGKKPKSVVR